MGSLHLLTPDFYPLPASMEKAFARADTLVEEIDMNEANGAAFTAMVLSKAMYPAGTTLATQVSKETLPGPRGVAQSLRAGGPDFSR